MRNKKYGFLGKYLRREDRVTDEEFGRMKKVTKDNSRVDNKFHLYFSLETRLVIRLFLFVLLAICSYWFVRESYSVEGNAELPYTEYGNVNYRVLVNSDEYYGDNYLESGKQYLSDVINTIETNFDYNLNLTRGMNYKYSYSIDGTLYIDSEDSGKNLITNNYNFAKQDVTSGVDGTQISVQEPINLNFKEYNDFVKNYKRKYGIDVTSKLVVKMSVDYEGIADIFKAKKNKKSVVEMTIPLGEKETSVAVKKIDSSDKFIEKNGNKLDNDVLLCAGIVLFVIAVLILFNSISFLIKLVPKKSKYDKKKEEILKNYDRVIVVSKKEPDIYGLKVIECNSFNELFDAQQALEKPIVYYEIVKGQKALFIINNGTEVYRYVLKDCDL
jgi:hypothetical protein